MLLAQDKAVGVIVYHHDIVVLGKLHQTLVGFALSSATSRHIGIVGPHELHLREVHLLKLLKIGLPTIVLTQIVVHNLGPQDLR